MSLDAALCSLFANSPHEGSGMKYLLWETDIKPESLLRNVQEFMLSNTTWHFFKYWWFDMIWNDVYIWPVIHFSLCAVTWFYCPDVLGVTGHDVTSTWGSLTMRRDVMWPDVRPHGLTWCDIDISLRGGTRHDVTWWFAFKDSKVFHLRTSYSPIHPLSIDRFLPECLWMLISEETLITSGAKGLTDDDSRLAESFHGQIYPSIHRTETEIPICLINMKNIWHF